MDSHEPSWQQRAREQEADTRAAMQYAADREVWESYDDADIARRELGVTFEDLRGDPRETLRRRIRFEIWFAGILLAICAAIWLLKRLWGG